MRRHDIGMLVNVDMPKRRKKWNSPVRRTGLHCQSHAISLSGTTQIRRRLITESWHLLRLTTTSVRHVIKPT